MIIGCGSDPQQFFRLVDFHRGAVAIIVSLNCVTSALSFGPGLFRKAFACSTRISFVSVPSNFTVPSIKFFSCMARGSLPLFRRSVCTHGGAISRTLTEVAFSLWRCERTYECSAAFVAE